MSKTLFPNELPVHNKEINKIGWKNNKLYVCFNHPIYYYTYTGVPEDLWWIFRDSINDNARLKGAGSSVEFDVLFHYLIKIHPKLFPYKKRSFKSNGD